MSRRRRRILGAVGVASGIIANGLTAWYDFSSSSFLTLSATAITQALDRSGNGNHTDVQGTSTKRPTFTANQINGLPAAVVDGGDALALPSGLFTIPNGNNTVFTVSKRTGAAAAQARNITLSEGGSTRLASGYTAVADTYEYQSRTAAGTSVSATGFTETDWIITTGFRSGTTQSISINGGTAVTDTNGASENAITEGSLFANGLGTALFLTGVGAEYIIYNRALSAAEIAQVERYLATKYGITLA